MLAVISVHSSHAYPSQFAAQPRVSPLKPHPAAWEVKGSHDCCVAVGSTSIGNSIIAAGLKCVKLQVEFLTEELNRPLPEVCVYLIHITPHCPQTFAWSGRER